MLGCAGIALAGALATTTACQTRVCDGDFVVYGNDPREGRLIDENTWESVPFAGDPETGEWMPFPHQRTYLMVLRGLEGREIVRTDAYVTAAPNPSAPGENFTMGAGNPVLLTYSPRDNGLFVRNDTCVSYYLRVVVEVAPLPPASLADSGAVDASLDASVDAPADAPSDAPTD